MLPDLPEVILLIVISLLTFGLGKLRPISERVGTLRERWFSQPEQTSDGNRR